MAKQAKKRSRRAAHPAPSRKSGVNYWLIIAIAALATVVVVGLMLLGQQDSNPAPPPQLAEVSSDKSTGEAAAPVVVVEYADFQCPFCRDFALGPERQLLADYVETGKARFAFRHLAFIGPESQEAAEAAECANAQGRFWDYHHKLFEEQGGENVGAFSDENLKQFATELGLDSAQFNQCLDSNQYQAKVQQEIEEAERLGIRSTPTLFVNGQLIRNGSDYNVLRTAIESALQ
jgi:protein-disulfide isomerase